MKIQSAYNMEEEFTIEDFLHEVGSGWHPLIRDLVDNLFAAGWDGVIAQVKEKFGGLRFYIGGGNDEIFELIHEAEGKSYEICEDCGKPGKLREDRSWIRTLCNDCHGGEA